MEKLDSGVAALPMINEISHTEFPPCFRMKRMHRNQPCPVFLFTGARKDEAGEASLPHPRPVHGKNLKLNTRMGRSRRHPAKQSHAHCKRKKQAATP